MNDTFHPFAIEHFFEKLLFNGKNVRQTNPGRKSAPRHHYLQRNFLESKDEGLNFDVFNFDLSTLIIVMLNIKKISGFVVNFSANMCHSSN